MDYIGRSKVGKVNPNPRSSYPFIRLPQQYSGFIGKTAHIFKTEHEGQLALFILFDNGEKISPNIVHHCIILYNLQPKSVSNLASQPSNFQLKK